MNIWASRFILTVAAIAALLLLASEVTSPALYTALNTSTAAHVDPGTVPGHPGSDVSTLISMMDALLEHTGSLTFMIKHNDYKSAERDLAHYSDLSRQFDQLVVTLDVSGTDIGEFQQSNQENFASLATLLHDVRRFEDLQRLEIEVRDDDEQHAAIVYESETLRQKMQEGFATYVSHEAEVTEIGEKYRLNLTPYQESIRNFVEIANATEERWNETRKNTKSPLLIGVIPGKGRYGDTLSITGSYVNSTPGTPVEVYVNSRIAGNATLDELGNYTCSYLIGKIPAGQHLVHATSGPIYSGVARFLVQPQNTTITLAVRELNRPTIICTGNLMAENGRPVAGAPVILRIDGTTLIGVETDRNGNYRREVTLSAGEHAIRAEFHAVNYPLNTSESPTATAIIRGQELSPLPFVAAVGAALGTGWYLRRRLPVKNLVATGPMKIDSTPVIETTPEVDQTIPSHVEIAALPPRVAATVLFHTLRARLGLPETKTPRDCAWLVPAHAGFFERYERIRYAGEIPSEEELQAMEQEALGWDDDAA
ncbi:hypothetical protein [Methanoculleus sp.]|uniref:hypothetical protein n=1 Tax=Methanoculleus sp. TaxID=90427 RepID=UPI0025E44A74|nr:hypothetical protein [Methanoculleus sp.]